MKCDAHSSEPNSFNKGVVLMHLKESLEELEKTISQIETDESYSEINLEFGLGHLYHHVNTAWNGRHQSDEQHKHCDQADFNRFRRFPKEEEFNYLAPLQQ